MGYLLQRLINNLGYIIVIVFIVTRMSSFKKIARRANYRKLDLILLSVIFGAFGILGTYVGTEVNGAIANTRIISIVTGGILCGPFVGVVSGIIAGVHRYFVHFGNDTAVPCAIATVLAGIISSRLYNIEKKELKWVYGFIFGIILESMEMLLILLITKPFNVAKEIVKSIYLPMSLANALGIALLIILVQNILREEEDIAANEAQIALEIANKTLPYFRDIDGDSLEKICTIIKDSVGADAVAITDREYILAHVGKGEDHHIKGREIITKATKQVIKDGKIKTISDKGCIECSFKGCPLRSAIIVPLRERDEIIGTLKIYYTREDAVTMRTKNLAIGLSQIISTQFEISKLEKLRIMASKAEIKALQAQINPHFLFNALNTITSFVRINPNRARELIIDLSTYLRYNLDIGENPVDIYRELEQVKAYVDIEKARFDQKLNVIYDVDDGIDKKIPSLLIQPLVENSIKHGILEGKGHGTVIIRVNKVKDNKVKVIIEDDGIGISEEIINKVYAGELLENKIGLLNVHQRLLNIYGKGLFIEKLQRGTRISFEV